MKVKKKRLSKVLKSIGRFEVRAYGTQDEEEFWVYESGELTMTFDTFKAAVSYMRSQQEG